MSSSTPTTTEPADAPLLTADDLLARLLYRDAMMLVIDKPAGVPVHAGSGGGFNLEQALDALRFGLPRAPGLAHRLDRDTSGCLVLGRHRRALARLGRLFAGGTVRKTYWAVVAGDPPAYAGTIDQPLAKVGPAWNWHVRVDPAGRAAVTDWRVLGRADGLAWLELQPRTGRTHQLRVHCQWLGLPIVGDPHYGGGDLPAGLQLLARAVTVPLYPAKPAIAVEAPPPPHMRERLARCGWTG